MEKKPKNAAKDLVFGVVLLAFSIYIIVASLGMKFKDTFIDGAGFFPMIIGVVLAVLAAVLIYIGIMTGGVKELKEVLNAQFIADFFKEDSTYRVLILIAMLVIYIFIMLDLLHIPFVWASAVYLFANYMYLGACKKMGPIPGWVVAIIISIALPFIAYYAFKLGLGITLP